MTRPAQTWPPELDAVVAAAEHHRLALENDSVRVLETRIEPGETVSLHTHCWPAVYYILSWSDFVRRDENGDVLLDTRETAQQVEPGHVAWSAPLAPHTLENVGSQAIHLISIEVKTNGGIGP
jgi:quercetin dioxygenase-like cupin family protein